MDFSVQLTSTFLKNMPLIHLQLTILVFPTCMKCQVHTWSGGEGGLPPCNPLTQKTYLSTSLWFALWARGQEGGTHHCSPLSGSVEQAGCRSPGSPQGDRGGGGQGVFQLLTPLAKPPSMIHLTPQVATTSECHLTMTMWNLSQSTGTCWSGGPQRLWGSNWLPGKAFRPQHSAPGNLRVHPGDPQEAGYRKRCWRGRTPSKDKN